MEVGLIRVAIVEDGVSERESVLRLLEQSPGFCCVGAFASAEHFLGSEEAITADVVLMDIHLPGMSGIEAVRRFKAGSPPGRVLMLTVLEDHDRIFEALRAGANGYLLKRTAPDRLLASIRELHEGGAPMSGPIARQVVAAFHAPPATPNSGLAQLSARERETLDLLARGFAYKEIADRLGITLGTVRTHVARVYEKLHIHSRAEAMLRVLGPGK